ncbi:Sensor kinase CckA [Palleronia abyssalis]|uniref:histidine kinase n=2 Tax=Palleronia abyssalis TaxID=1501240 RepID=A0A2R8C075_9RHOB|nr:Sensor kinase CckA [Palleronia abyssalis]
MAQRAFAVSRLTPPMMIANIINAFSIPFVFYLEDQSRIDAFVWAAIVIAMACYFLVLSHARRHKPFPTTMSLRTYRKSIGQACLLGAFWAYPGLVILPEVEGLSQAFLVAMAAGMVAGGAITLYPMPLAAYGFSGLILAGSMGGFSRTDEPAFWGFALVAATFAMIIFRSILRHERIFVSEFILRRSIDRQKDRMGEMLEAAREEVRAERRLAEDRLVQTQKMEAIGQLTAGIAHDFNNLLAAVRGHAELLQLETDTQSDLIDPIIQSADSGAALVRQLLAFARKQSLMPQVLCPRKAVHEAANLLRRGLREDIEIRLDVDNVYWPIRIDPHLFSNALLNLGTNARDAMPQGGTITISARDLPGDGSVDSPGDLVRISFCDTGIGMPEDVRARATEPFFTTKEFGAGSGLGLSMVYGFVKQSGGETSFENAPGGGTCVHLDLPRSRETPDASEAKPPDTRPTVGERKVLLVEDNPAVRQAILSMIESLGYAVRGVGTLEAARAALADMSARPDIVVTDIVLPGGQWGTTFVAELSQTNPELGVVLISGFHFGEDELGPDIQDTTHLAKPFSRDQLAAALNDVWDSLAKRR